MRAIASLCALLLSVSSATAATVVVVNQDAPGEGFNDATVVAAVGGNPGTTLGQQRLNVFQRAADIWGSVLPSNVQIRINAQFNSIVTNPPCSATSGVLGSCSPNSWHSNFAGAIYPNTQYVQALANRLSGVDQDASNDMFIQFNTDVDNATCLGPSNWYYGYDGNEGTNVELLSVALHELGHGLGFTSGVDPSTGAFLGNGVFPTVYSRFVYDASAAAYWNQMSNAQRLASFTNTGNVVWDGPAVNAQAPLILEGRRILTVNSPAGIAGTYFVGIASFGADVSAPVVTANLVQVQDGAGANPNDGCEAITNPAQLAGRIALIDRGNCTFTFKAAAVQAVGAVGAVIVDNAAAGTPPEMGGTDPTITIPVVSVTQNDGNLLKANLAAGISMTLGGQHPTLKAGLSAAGRALLYAPSPIEPGSSISHWDKSALPNLLLEPVNTTSLHDWLDLTRYVFVDEGWFAANTGVGPLAQRGIELRSVPNPFASTTRIQFQMATGGPARIEILDLAGRRLRSLTGNDLAPGPQALDWDGRTDEGRRVPAGVYLVRLTAEGRTETGRTVRVD